jgi:hypothetical protein
MTKLEQVARALFDKASEDRPLYDRVSWEELGPKGWEHFMGLARVVVEALRELSDYQSDVLAAKDMMWMNVDSKFIWQTFIDAILSEKTDA